MKDFGLIKMPWGKFKDKMIGEIPSSYLHYVAEQWDEKTALKKQIVKACSDEWEYRENLGCHFED